MEALNEKPQEEVETPTQPKQRERIEIPQWKQNQFAARGEGIFNLSPGWVSNPLHSGTIRNEPCICGSGKKVKKCCGRDAIIRDPRFNYSTQERHRLKDSTFHEKASEVSSV